MSRFTEQGQLEREQRMLDALTGYDASRILAADDARKHCVRCGADVHAPDPPHLCKDLRERKAKQEQIIGDIANIIAFAGPTETPWQIAEDIYRMMSGRDLP